MADPEVEPALIAYIDEHLLELRPPARAPEVGAPGGVTRTLDNLWNQLQVLINLELPPNRVAVVRKTQAAGDLAANKFYKVAGIPANTRTWRIVNLSTQALNFWFTGDSSAPAGAFRTLDVTGKPASIFATDSNPPFLTVLPPVGVADAGFEAEFWYLG